MNRDTPAFGALGQLAGAGALVLAIRIGLWMLPFGWIRWLADKIGRPQRNARRLSAMQAGEICRAVMRVSRLVPRASCLTQALAAEALLSRHGFACQLCIGINRNASGLKAHAWLEDSAGNVLTGHADLSNFARLAEISAG